MVGNFNDPKRYAPQPIDLAILIFMIKFVRRARGDSTDFDVTETQWSLKINTAPGTEVKQGEIATSSGELSTSGLYTCVALGLSTRDKTFLAHVDAGCCPSILAHWIDAAFGDGSLPTVHLWNYAGTEVPFFGHAPKLWSRH
jgi:hypothetical protein